MNGIDAVCSEPHCNDRRQGNPRTATSTHVEWIKKLRKSPRSKAIFALEDTFETVNGRRPEARPLPNAIAKRWPLPAFAVLGGGDLFDGTGASSAPTAGENQRDLNRYLRSHIDIAAEAPTASRLTAILGKQLGDNASLVGRLREGKPIDLVVASGGQGWQELGLPGWMAPHAAGVFWDAPDWPRAKIALRGDALDRRGDVLVAHEMAHAIHYIAFSEQERRIIYRFLQPVFASRAAMDEVFAIYSEREFASGFTDSEKAAPGVYGLTRSQWSEDHVFTRFVRKLYFPTRALAGPKMAPLPHARPSRSNKSGGLVLPAPKKVC